jgi:hypothetical protein
MRRKTIVVAASGALTALFASAIVITAQHALAAGPRPLFQLPFTCGQQWVAFTRSDHSPNPNSLDLTRLGGETNGQPILASYGGRVAASGWSNGGGNYVRIDHGNGWQTRYLHMISAPEVRNGQQVAQGQRIGRVGSTGNSSGPHLHYEQLQDGATVRSAFNGSLVSVQVGRGQNLTSHNCGSANLGILDFHLSDSLSSSTATRPVIRYGNSPMLPIVGDWDGNGTDTVSTYDPTSGRFFISNNPATGQAQYSFQFGNAGAHPLVGDWDGDGKDNVGVRMGMGFFLRTTAVSDPAEAAIVVNYGEPGHLPLIGDWDGDGKDNVGVYVPGVAQFHLRLSANTDPAEVTTMRPYGNPNAVPLVGDWNGDGRDNIGVRMGITYFFRTSEITTETETSAAVGYGNGTTLEIPVIGDWNGDNRDTHGIVY